MAILDIAMLSIALFLEAVMFVTMRTDEWLVRVAS